MQLRSYRAFSLIMLLYLAVYSVVDLYSVIAYCIFMHNSAWHVGDWAEHQRVNQPCNIKFALFESFNTVDLWMPITNLLHVPKH